MREYQRGDVVLVRFPFTDLRTTKLRPAIVLAVHGEDIIVVGIFSNIPNEIKDTWLIIEENHSSFKVTGLKKRSIVKAEKLAVVHHSVIHSTIGSLHPTLIHSLDQLIKKALCLIER
jgi:mRNA interferase MazF